MSPTPPDNTKEIPERHRFNEKRLQAWLREKIEGFGDSLSVRQFRGGQSNPTFWLSDGERAYVLRKQPSGKLLPSAHAVDREFRVMHALQGSEVPVPKMYALCEDREIIGTSFYVMDYMRGKIFWNLQLPECSKEQRQKIYEHLVEILASLHRINIEELGLSDYGKHGQYIARQVGRWTKQYLASQTSDIVPMNALIEWLPQHIPSNDETTLCHGDYRLDNLIFSESGTEPLAVIDWELSTLGHPLADLAYTCMLYHVALPKIGGLLDTDFDASGIPSQDAFVARYCELSGRDAVGDLPYFKAFSLFRLAGIAQGVYKRSQQGNASSDEATMFGAAVPHLASIACQLVGVSDS